MVPPAPMMAAILSDVRSATARRVVLQMCVTLGGAGLTMPEHLAEEIEAVTAEKISDRGSPKFAYFRAERMGIEVGACSLYSINHLII
jgi:hypothetical protein